MGRVSISLIVCLAVASCLDDTKNAAAKKPRGRCSSKLCPSGTCVRVPDDPRGFSTCATLRPEATACKAPNRDKCCRSSDCKARPGGGCFFGPQLRCSGEAPERANVCLYDECQSDTDCKSAGVGICLARGAFHEYRTRCVYGTCRFDEGCGERPGGQCVPFFDPCSRRMVGFHCTYDDSGCRSNADCRPGYCAPGPAGKSQCRPYSVPS